jgi:hypothetical protein
MKRLLVFLVTFTLLACVQEEVDKTTGLQQEDIETVSSREMDSAGEVDMKRNLRCISYGMGRVIQRNSSVRDAIKEALHEDSLTFDELFAIKGLEDALREQFLYFSEKPIPGENRPIPPVGTGRMDEDLERAEARANNLIDYIKENCFELYFPRPFTIDDMYTTMYTFHHPLGGGDPLPNCKIWIDDHGWNQGEFPPKNQRMYDIIIALEESSGELVENVIVVQPYNGDCSYESLGYFAPFFPKLPASE